LDVAREFAVRVAPREGVTTSIASPSVLQTSAISPSVIRLKNGSASVRAEIESVIERSMPRSPNGA
jgi:hypothetical protein